MRMKHMSASSHLMAIIGHSVSTEICMLHVQHAINNFWADHAISQAAVNTTSQATGAQCRRRLGTLTLMANLP